MFIVILLCASKVYLWLLVQGILISASHWADAMKLPRVLTPLLFQNSETKNFHRISFNLLLTPFTF